jgi:hypothetical protein
VRLRVLAVAVIALLFALTQTMGSGLSVLGWANVLAAPIDGQRPASVVQQDDNAEDDDADADNEEDDADTDADNDEEDVAGDNDEGDVAGDNDDSDDAAASGAPATTASPVIADAALNQPLTTATGTTNGGDMMIATPGERVAVRVFPWMPAGVEITIRPVDASTVPAPPGSRAGDLTFAIEARDASGTQLTALPAEANLAVRYADSTVSGLNEGSLTLSRLDPTTNQWQPAPKVVREADSNYVGASVMQVGTYTVSAQ